MLRELKVFLDQLEREVLRAQGSEGNLTDKYQVRYITYYIIYMFTSYIHHTARGEPH